MGSLIETSTRGNCSLRWRDIKKQIQGYSPFASESVRGKATFPKESVYFFREGADHEDLKYLTPEFYRSVKALPRGPLLRF